MRSLKTAHSRAAKQRGFSLIEVLFAVAISSVSILGLMAMTVISIQSNQRGDRRNDSVRVASETAEVLMTVPFDDVVDCQLLASNNSSQGTTPPSCLSGQDIDLFPDPTQEGLVVSNDPEVSYDVLWDVTALSDDLKQIDITVNYSDGTTQQTNQVTIYKHREI